MAPQKQQAVFHVAQSKFVVKESDVPQPQKDEVLVKFSSVALNPFDHKVLDNILTLPKSSSILGLEGAGMVESIGKDVTDIAVGDNVFFQAEFNGPSYGCFQQYGISNAEFLSKFPNNISADQAATVAAGALTAVVGLYDQSGFGLLPPWQEAQPRYANEHILILGGSSSVGQYVIQYASLSGFKHIIATSSLQYESYLSSLGATHVLDRSQSPDQIASEVRKIIGGDNLIYVFDAVSNESTNEAGWKSLSDTKKGTLVHTNLPFSPKLKYHPKAPNPEAKLIAAVAQFHPELAHAFFRTIGGYLKDGEIKPNRVEVLPGGLKGIGAGLDRLRQWKVSGVKLVIHPQETP